MKRICSLCLKEVPYKYVKKYPHGLQLCSKCIQVINDTDDVWLV